MPDGNGPNGLDRELPTTNQTGPCDKYMVETLRYLDDDLKGQELEDFRSHLTSCSNCRAHLDEEKALSQLLHRFRPLYSAPASLRGRVSEATEASASISTARDRLDRSMSQTVAGIWSGFRSRVLAPAAIAITLCLLFVPNIARNARASSYAQVAAARHRSYLNGSLPPELLSNSAQQVTAWFAGKVPFDFRLPAMESTPEDKPAYRLTGASVVNYKGSPAAFVMYETRSEKISLLVDLSKVATVAGGEEVRFGKLTFHYRNESGFRVITWSSHGLSYALVSSVSGPARTSCLICHQSMTDHSTFKVRQ
jgi:anti-sigma factor (TIGR02949 family)